MTIARRLVEQRPVRFVAARAEVGIISDLPYLSSLPGRHLYHERACTMCSWRAAPQLAARSTSRFGALHTKTWARIRSNWAPSASPNRAIALPLFRGRMWSIRVILLKRNGPLGHLIRATATATRPRSVRSGPRIPSSSRF
jgi:hypothetical protein